MATTGEICSREVVYATRDTTVLAEEMTGMTRIVGRERAHEQASRK